VIEKYTIITPTAWNLSTQDSNGVKGVVESALMGTTLDEHKIASIGRIVRSFDPCVSCATHVVTSNQDITLRIV